MSVNNNNMAIYFADPEYLEGFMNYMTDRNSGFICSGFTRGDNLTDFAEKNNISVLLTDDICFQNGARNIKSEITIVLTEKPGSVSSEKVYEINILQPVDEIVRDILKTAAKSDVSVADRPYLSSAAVYSFFSPVGRSLKTTLAVTASQILSDKEKTIYINLEPDSGFTILFGQEFSSDLSDLIFFLQGNTGNKVSLILQSSICTCQGVSFIPPVMNPEDLFHITSDDILTLLDLLQRNGFKSIVIDIGYFIPGFEKILDSSTKIYMPVRKDRISSSKIAQFYSFLRTLDDLSIEDNLAQLDPPYFNDIPPITCNLRSTEIGKYITGILNER